MLKDKLKKKQFKKRPKAKKKKLRNYELKLIKKTK
jgi:hypothetical protein